ncbi:hypothetical protein KZZ52_55795 [Dactylosporangium sp. AC04546]|uniref:hypothetical protein n=1 Tax=Dactylosporangium sp. AC04546 TaxID=2862460 RepID=UPI001EDD8F81|nr:hypothetical protein [Dactylosporangium sp. AC04546]WVK83090.1 hypothetical protein KZZ52_55795 [Dactylosporangium sp. AC04546]
MRAHRLAPLAVLALLAVSTGLAGCRSSPAVAAYLGDRTITVAQVDEVVRAVNAVGEERWAARRAGGPAPQPPLVHTTAAEVVSLIVLRHVGERLVRERGLSPAPRSPDMFAAIFGLPPSDPYVQLWLDYWQMVQPVVAAHPERPPTDEEADRVLDALVNAGQVPAGIGYDEMIADLKRYPAFGAAGSAQQTLAAAASGVTINPRYGGLVLPAILSLPSGPVPIDIAFPDDGKVPVEEA